MHDDTLLPLEFSAPGQWVEVADVSGDDAWVARIAELGLRPGSRVRILQPGSPCLLQVGGARLILRADLAAQVLVRPAPPERTWHPAAEVA